MESFTPYSALAGGVLIGLSAALLLWFNGRIAGISGIARGLFSGDREAFWWRALFLAGLVAGAWLYYVVAKDAGHAVTLPHSRPGFPPVLLIAGGLAVGFGTALARGCTSGHGVCGLARLSPRSFVATLTFLPAGIATTYVVRHMLGVQ
ncbi:YeeE/YedE family protein [Paraburkholderia sp. 1N]|uniref:YeeE/YedE family protein n=1 Tax=Paraburkholderia solitsugae TaxID=2675748 RepID=A0ABX2C077_9BURK|nr:YeeE/YedE family protein [Paraburkholderia solitsugae]NPT46384.1 YeeE/YedE family protein [Paraburkholderia solitsugae]